MTSLADDVTFHPPSPNDVILSACQRQQQSVRQSSRSQRVASSKKVQRRVIGSVRPFVCPSCLAAFVNRATLVRHARVHTGERPYCCPICSRTFTQSGNLTRHIRSKHSSPVVIGNGDKHPPSSSAAAVMTSSPHYVMQWRSWKIKAKASFSDCSLCARTFLSFSVYYDVAFVSTETRDCEFTASHA